MPPTHWRRPGGSCPGSRGAACRRCSRVDPSSGAPESAADSPPGSPPESCPCRPTNIMASAGNSLWSSSSSSGVGGRMPPSYQIRSTAGRWPARRILEAHHARGREREIVLDGAEAMPSVNMLIVAQHRLDAGGPGQFQRTEHRPQTVVPHVRHRAAAEIVPAAEHHVRVVGMVRALGLGSQPEIPIEALRDGRRIGRERRHTAATPAGWSSCASRAACRSSHRGSTPSPAPSTRWSPTA